VSVDVSATVAMSVLVAVALERARALRDVTSSASSSTDSRRERRRCGRTRGRFVDITLGRAASDGFGERPSSVRTTEQP